MKARMKRVDETGSTLAVGLKAFLMLRDPSQGWAAMSCRACGHAQESPFAKASQIDGGKAFIHITTTITRLKLVCCFTVHHLLKARISPLSKAPS